MGPTIQIIVVSCNEERKRLVANQFKELGITIPYTFFEGYTPATSKEYLVDKHSTAPEFDTTQCCMRSHAGALHHYVTHYPDSQFVLILEDDVCLLRSFEAELHQVMNRWLRHISELDFVSIGYQLAKTDSGKHTSLCSDSNLYWNLSGTDGTGNVWGAIGYLVKRSAALSMASVLHKPTSKELRESIDKFIREDRKGMQFANKIQRNQSDVLMSVGWRQAVVFPLLAIEMPIESTISPGVNNTTNGIWENVFRLGSRKRDEFYSIPPTPTASIPPQAPSSMPPPTVASLIANVKKEKLVGIVVHDKASMFSNGIVQNAFFLYQCLEAIGYTCQFLCGEANPSPFEHDKLSVKQITTDSAVFDPSQYHTIITVTRRISPEIHALCQRHNVRVISLICGNCYVLDQEDFVRGLVGDSISFLGESRNIDEQWLIPSYHHSLEYMELIRKKPTTLVPHLWAPSILKKYAPLALGKPESSMFYDATKRKNPKINIIIMEPNMSMMKTAWMPLLACEKLHTLRPDLIEHVFVFNFPEHKNSWTMVESLSVGPKVRKFARKSVAEIMWHFNTQSECFPLFLSHQMLNSLNYIYYELLYYGFPLVHNSPDLDGCGYMYPENHISKCVEQLLLAYQTHNSMLETYKANASKYLNRVDPFDAKVQAAFDERIVASLMNVHKPVKVSSLIHKIVYINLDARTDRRAEIERELAKMGLTGERFPAIKAMPGSVGCSLSHIGVLRKAIAEGWESVLILEDDFQFVIDQPTFEMQLRRVSALHILYDVILFSCNLIESQPYNELLSCARDVQTTAGYLVHKRFYKQLLENFEEGVGFLAKGETPVKYALDMYWKSLQKTSRWFSFNAPIGIQRPGYSDIEHKIVNYNA
jgi:GR25 family glycosyltransferase involved in LPS biosynthesis